MATFNPGYRVLKGCCRPAKAPWRQLRALRLGDGASISARRTMATAVTEPPEPAPAPGEITDPTMIKAAGEVTLERSPELDLAGRARAVPVSPSYFSRRPTFNDAYLLVVRLYEKYKLLPTVPAGEAPRVVWKTLVAYRTQIGEDVRAADFAKCMEIVRRLHQINPELKPYDVDRSIKIFKRDIQDFNNRTKAIPIDRFGRAVGVGKRKTSVARAWVVEGTGEVLINGKTLAAAFGRVHDRESATWALRATDRMDKYNVWALVGGGGTTGQAEALTLAVAKALMAHEPALKPALRRAGCVTRDPRKVERKKAGHVKARKSPTWVKR